MFCLLLIMKNQTISVVIYTRNEEKNIKECIESAKRLTKNILVVDMESNDKTIEIAKNEGVNIISFPYSFYVEPAREFGIQKIKTDWVFILDADERITDQLVEEIKAKIPVSSQSPGAPINGVRRTRNTVSSVNFTHYRIPRKNIFGKIKWLKHGGWWSDYQIRLINKKYFKAWPKEIHSMPVIEGEGGYLKNPLSHYFHGDIEQMVKKTIIFENIESNLLYKANKNVSTTTFFRKSLGELFRRMIKGKGFLDGTIGIIESIYQAFSKTITYIFLYEKKNRTL
jgi:glycosyltransferase involved in cell wall biosynthesis